MDASDASLALLDAAPDAMIVVDSAGLIVHANVQTARIFGHAREELVGRPVELLMPQRFRERHVGHREAYERDARVRPMGHGLALFGVAKDGREFPVEISLSPTTLGGRHVVIAAIRDVTDRARLEDETRRQLVTKQFVRRILRELSARGGESAHTRRDLGRSLASETGAKDVPAFLDAFLAMGVGALQVVSVDRGRYEFVGTGLLEMTPGAGKPTCHIALGFLEGLVSGVESSQALGTEVQCQSQGKSECRFVVKAKPA